MSLHLIEPTLRFDSLIFHLLRLLIISLTCLWWDWKRTEWKCNPFSYCLFVISRHINKCMHTLEARNPSQLIYISDDILCNYITIFEGGLTCVCLCCSKTMENLWKSTAWKAKTKSVICMKTSSMHAESTR